VLQGGGVALAVNGDGDGGGDDDTALDGRRAIRRRRRLGADRAGR
jgi:hypothetical protein